jgi:hypothetical protein
LKTWARVLKRIAILAAVAADRFLQTFLNQTLYPSAMIVYGELDGWALFADAGQYGGDNASGRRWLSSGAKAYVWFYSPGTPPFGAPQVVWAVYENGNKLLAGPEGKETPVLDLAGVSALAITVNPSGTLTIVADHSAGNAQ